MGKIKRYLIRSDTSIYAVSDAEAEKIEKRIWRAVSKATDLKANPKRAIRYSNIRFKKLKSVV